MLGVSWDLGSNPVVQETMKVAQSDDIIMMRDVARREKIHAEKMRSWGRDLDPGKGWPPLAG